MRPSYTQTVGCIYVTYIFPFYMGYVVTLETRAPMSRAFCRACVHCPEKHCQIPTFFVRNEFLKSPAIVTQRGGQRGTFIRRHVAHNQLTSPENHWLS